ncbi:DUF2975 domain-containing protein [Stenotrophomonas rhizophila]|nr:DUF2975 domain-containing protein [Stenotrophomonas rhizophila]
MTSTIQPSETPRPLIAICAISLAWVVAAIELATPGLLWGLEYPAMLDALLADNAASMPMLGVTHYMPSKLVMVTVVGLDCLIALTAAAPLFFTGLLFKNLQPSHAWTDLNIRWLRSIGILCLCMPLIKSLAGLLQSLALSWDLPSGNGGANLGLDLSSAALSQIAMGLLLCAFASVMRNAKSIHDENKCYV